jgi:5-methylcytosine-specific restriction endonuclease McrA
LISLTDDKRKRLADLWSSRRIWRQGGWSGPRSRPVHYGDRWAALYEDRFCLDCGSPEALEYDHREPTTKLFNVSQGLYRPWAVLEAEAAKCDLVCRPCHRRRTKNRVLVEGSS